MNKQNKRKHLTFFLLITLCVQTSVLAKSPVLNTEQVSQLINQSLNVMQAHYIEPDIVPDLREIFVHRKNLGQYNEISSTRAFADVFGRDLRALTGDSHLSLFIIEPEEELTHILTHPKGKLTHNYSFEQVKYLAGNIGYLKFNKFHPDERATQTVDAAFDFLQTSTGMIIDLRDTIGGSPLLAQYMLSYFLPMKTKLWEYLDSNNAVLDTISVEQHAGHTRFQSTYPVWILTSHNTASASELFAGVLQANAKASIVGSVTAGAGYAVGVRKITDELVFRISLSKPVISANQQNWEKIGLTPDYDIPAIDALDQAHRLSLASPLSE